MTLIDTHALLWWRAGGRRLSTRATRALSVADEVYISTITCWEMALLVARGRIRIDRDPHTWFRDLFAEQAAQPIPVSPEAAVKAGQLAREGLGGDPADGIIYATALEHGLPIVTKDRRIADFARARGDVKTIW